jgi:hypothetical protein
METGTSIKVRYGTEQTGAFSSRDLDGADEFRKELAESYVSVVHARPRGLGGLHDIAIEIVSSISLVHVVKLLLDGTAYDLLKSGTEAFVLRPFLIAHRKLRDRNKSNRVDIGELRIIFQDSMLIIMKISNDSIFSNIERILLSIATHYDSLCLTSGEPPFEIYVPVFEDLANDRLCRFRVLLDVDETITDVSSTDYLKFWGLWYDYSGQPKYRVYDIERRLLLDTEFYTLDRYWKAWEARRRGDTKTAS